MSKVVECVPNISEGCNKKIVEQIVDTVRNTRDVKLADYSSDANHNRSVITFFGSPEAVEESVVKLACKAVELIDLTKHSGEHPKMGAVDVIPFIPVKNMTMDETVILSKKVAERIWSEAKLPVYLYEFSAGKPYRTRLEDIRRGGFTGMFEKVIQDGWEPDFGGCTVHPTAGVCAVGARNPLVAFNINLSTSDISIANSIAKTIRKSSGGFDGVKAIGIFLEDRNIAQVSINFTDLDATPVHVVVDAVRDEAQKHGTEIAGTELIGLAPVKTFIDCAKHYLKLENFDREKQIIENHLSNDPQIRSLY